MEEVNNVRELAIEISLASFGSSQTFPFPQPSTLAASRFWIFSDTIFHCDEIVTTIIAHEIGGEMVEMKVTNEPADETLELRDEWVRRSEWVL